MTTNKQLVEPRASSPSPIIKGKGLPKIRRIQTQISQGKPLGLKLLKHHSVHLSFILSHVKKVGFDSLNIASKFSLAVNLANALCNEAGEGGDGNGGAVGGCQGDMEEGGRQGEGGCLADICIWVQNQDHPHCLWETKISQFPQHPFVLDLVDKQHNLPPGPAPSQSLSQVEELNALI